METKKILCLLLACTLLICLYSCTDEVSPLTKSTSGGTQVFSGKSGFETNSTNSVFNDVGYLQCSSITNLGVVPYHQISNNISYQTPPPIAPYDEATGGQMVEVKLQLNNIYPSYSNGGTNLCKLGLFKIELVPQANVRLVGAYFTSNQNGNTAWKTCTGNYLDTFNWSEIYSTVNATINVVVSTTNTSNTNIILNVVGMDGLYNSATFQGSTVTPISVQAAITGVNIVKFVRSLDGTIITDVQYSISSGPWKDFNSSVFVIDNSSIRYRATYSNPVYPTENAEYTITPSGARYYGLGSQTITTQYLNSSDSIGGLISFSSQVGND